MVVNKMKNMKRVSVYIPVKYDKLAERIRDSGIFHSVASIYRVAIHNFMVEFIKENEKIGSFFPG